MDNLTIPRLTEAARDFCELERGQYMKELFSITDGKAVGTFVEHRFKAFLSDRYTLDIGNTAEGLDLPSVNTDIKVTSARLPQSSCPYRDSKQKIYGLGYNLLVFVYSKHDDNVRKASCLNFVSCTFIAAGRTADYQTTFGLRQIIQNGGNEEDIFAFLCDHKIPADEVTLMNMARDILREPPALGYLTISNALQWLLQYSRAVSLGGEIEGITSVFKA